MSVQAGFRGDLYIGAAGAAPGAITSRIEDARDVTITMSADEIDRSARVDAPWKNFLQGLKEWSIDATILHDELDTVHDTLENAFFSGDAISIRAVDTDGEGFYGDCKVMTFPDDWSMGDVMQRSITIRGCGAPTRIPAAS
ncbi:hypothetical protein LCGC14_2087520 [marine sediment metagenome]|uniref:Uncharacterized protein n=1 Tax=marine sediment metagenome TaxID=412755 RepID=A0A0F9GRY1_9ZZZZ